MRKYIHTHNTKTNFLQPSGQEGESRLSETEAWEGYHPYQVPIGAVREMVSLSTLNRLLKTAFPFNDSWFTVTDLHH